MSVKHAGNLCLLFLRQIIRSKSQSVCVGRNLEYSKYITSHPAHICGTQTYHFAVKIVFRFYVITTRSMYELYAFTNYTKITVLLMDFTVTTNGYYKKKSQV